MFVDFVGKCLHIVFLTEHANAVFALVSGFVPLQAAALFES